MRICVVRIIPMVRPRKLLPLHLPLAPLRGQERKLEVRVWVLIRLSHLPTRLATTTTTRLAVSRNGKRFSGWTHSSTQPWMRMEATRTGRDNLAIRSRMAVSATARTSGVIPHRFLGRGRMARRCWGGNRWTTRVCTKVLGWLRGEEAVVKRMRL
jgi:hypothetical protein